MIKCPFCDSEYSSWNGISKHITASHPENHISQHSPLWVNAKQYLAGDAGPTCKLPVLKAKLLEEKLFEYKCCSCGNTEWLGRPIPLELHHKSGEMSRELDLSDIELLCPNCHAITDNYKSKNPVSKWESDKWS